MVASLTGAAVGRTLFDMSRSSLTALALLTASLLVGCGDDRAPTPLTDLGPRDGGSDFGALDAGVDVDTGVIEVDGGPLGTDAGMPDAGTDVDAATPCGAPCSAGFACGASGYCVSPTGVPAFDNVYVMVFENKDRGAVIGAAAAPYITSLASTYATGTQYTGVIHPSLGNYIALAAGDAYGVNCDCFPTGASMCNALTCNLILRNCNCSQDHVNVGDQLEAAGIEWRQYAEGMVTPCNTTDSGRYAGKHVPFLYFDSILGDPARCALRNRDYADFATDLAAGTFRFSFITPDLCNDMHDVCAGGNAVTQGDDWARAQMAPILARPGFAAGGHDVLFLVWDEGRSTVPIPLVIVSPLVRPGASTDVAYNHYSMLATWQDGLGIPRLAMSTGARPLDDIWR